MLLHASPMIEWLDDSLPDLVAVRARKEEFDLLMMTAVWMHLDEDSANWQCRTFRHWCAMAAP